jgi:sulfoxide reductase heme-binding subunit YedZ
VKDPGFAKFVVVVNGAVPLALLCCDAYYHHLGADPVAKAIHIAGMTALIFLMLSLTITPARKITGWNWLSLFRRTLGLYAFFYGLLHLSIYFVLDRQWSVSSLLHEVFNRKFIFFGMAGLLLLAPLAATSTNSMIKWMGAAKWKRLHQLVYPAAILLVIHFYMFGKADKRLQVCFIVVLSVLLAYRLLAPYVPGLRSRPRTGVA